MNQKQKIIKLLKSQEWTHISELNKICFRYGARLYELRSDGYRFMKRKAPDGFEEWKLIHDPITPRFSQPQEPVKLFDLPKLIS
jgi:hypothetical protein